MQNTHRTYTSLAVTLTPYITRKYSVKRAAHIVDKFLFCIAAMRIGNEWLMCKLNHARPALLSFSWLVFH